MKKIILVSCFFLSLSASARNLKDIISSGVFYAAVLNPEKDEFDTSKSIEKNKLINKFFENYTLRKFNKKISIKYIYANKFSEFWTNKNGVIIKEDTYSPNLFKSADAYFEFMSMSDWRVNKATPVSIFKSNLSLVCNFKPDNTDSNLKSIALIMKVMYDKTVNFIAIKHTKLDNSLERLKIPQNRIMYVNSRLGLVNGMLQTNKRECTLAETMLVLNLITKGKIYFIGQVTPYKNRALAWWIEKNNLELRDFIQELTSQLKNSAEWDTIFLELFGVKYNLYDFIMRNSDEN
ncbi:hypothetical protein [Fluviispira multicolorata]|uniref:Uncharacterized protein n=1 Tax=Fluviispira multicolorata TaxID=2654512 RepID=A0A833JDM4_9BACT|nr:hypothetical protein [Fluviispira multicolorata]KAB8030842.1 hypothetical protein GCL57_07660 [Fluviispira multicolorata]